MPAELPIYLASSFMAQPGRAMSYAMSNVAGCRRPNARSSMHAICCACGTQYAESPTPPASCPVCEDERQYVRWGGQAWTDLEALRRDHALTIADDHGVLGLDITPAFGIGQRALLVESPAGNVLWDCVSLVNEEAFDAIRARGGLAAIAISHPHYYTSMVDWSRAFGDVPIYLHQDDREWVQRPDPAIVFWAGETHSPVPGMTLIRCGGHFAGGTVMHCGDSLYAGDILQVGQDRKSVSFMYSYPNAIPLNAAAVRRIQDALRPFAFDRIHGAFRERSVARDGRAVFERSIVRYLAAIA
jgi:glyoxylase-like metal-dependent hydrolase (beta-lactamase superfamily II)